MKRKGLTIIIFIILIAILIYDNRSIFIKDEAKCDNNIQVNEGMVMPYYLDPNERDYITNMLYDYLINSNDNFEEYLNKLSNSRKLELGDFFNNDFESVKNNLLDYFGSDLGVEEKDYYFNDEDEVPMYVLKNGKYEYNEEFGATEGATPTGLGIYNYKMDDIRYENGYFYITYYGLYKTCGTLGPCSVYNNKNINRVLGLNEENNEDKDYIKDDQEYFETMFKKEKKNFFLFEYKFKKINNNYVLIDFQKK